MSGECQKEKAAAVEEQPKPTFFQRMFQKLDTKMKEKADESASCCCCSEDSKDKESSDKCC